MANAKMRKIVRAAKQRVSNAIGQLPVGVKSLEPKSKLITPLPTSSETDPQLTPSHLVCLTTLQSSHARTRTI